MITSKIPAWVDTRNLNICGSTRQTSGTACLAASDPEQDFVTVSTSGDLQVTYYGAGHENENHRVDPAEARSLYRALQRAQPQICQVEKRLLEVTDEVLASLAARGKALA